jgi:hypothetical protein
VLDVVQHLDLNAAQRQALQEQINQVPTRDEVAQKVAQAEALDLIFGINNRLSCLFNL